MTELVWGEPHDPIEEYDEANITHEQYLDMLPNGFRFMDAARYISDQMKRIADAANSAPRGLALGVGTVSIIKGPHRGS